MPANPVDEEPRCHEASQIPGPGRDDRAGRARDNARGSLGGPHRHIAPALADQKAADELA
jgi:hypothetical protein